MTAFSSRLMPLLALVLVTFTASAQNSTPRVSSPAPGAASTENGTPIATTSAPYNSKATPGYVSAPRMSASDIQAYKNARAACDRQSPGTQQDQCRARLLSKYAGVDAKCQKLSGGALDDCLKGADHAQ